MSSSLISTALVPPKFLQSAFLTGRIPFRLSRSHPNVSYTLYIPPHAYNPDPSRSSQEPPYNLPLLPLVVTIHGTSRNAEACRDRLRDFADKHHVAVLAPFFPAGITSVLDLDSYKLLRTPTFNSDQILLSIIDDEIAQIWPGIFTSRFFLTGYSGGGQFALRMLYIHPSRLDAVSIGAPGRPTFLDENEPWPRGIGDLEAVFGGGTKIDIDAIRAVKGIQLLVGSEDNFIHGGEAFMSFIEQFKAKIRNSSVENQQAAVDPSLDAMKEGRLDGLTRLRDSWKEHGVEANFDVVAGVAHEASKMSPTMMEFLLPLIEDCKKQLPS
ncbi:hypothetical protein LTR96_009499 [Exophiala xenobiotica]|nr:hypothetical protein LTR92_010397 [Exophiala xenobiotica]KAK5206210.1 hypothetical protein LTR41_008079 [Exophiala xenobiotica]KAK5217227.1 hypothetical protein LTR72_009793 [Exophiala xenobiotica]KAK5265132.1 hypothetical protein LTR96_009499 [Exophiala xenobiotica]KAK5287476.1 hypothetical protein LTR14_009139 [Exophiala xenobiotica]